MKRTKKNSYNIRGARDSFFEKSRAKNKGASALVAEAPLLAGGGGEPAMDLQSLTAEDIDALMTQGILPEQIAQIATESGQPIPPILAAMLPPDNGQNQMGPAAAEMPGEMPKEIPSKTSKFPAMMDIATYNQYKTVDKAERKEKMRAHKPNVFGYVFSDLVSEDILRDMKRTQGSFLVGVNLSNLFNEFRHMIVDDETKKSVKPGQTNLKKNNNSESTFKKVGEWIDIDYDKILERKMGFRGSDVPLLPEKQLTENASFYEIIDESKKYSESGFDGKITPLGLLIMTRMLYKYRQNNAQWIRVATILQLIYKYFGNGQEREEFFKDKDDIPIMALMDLEEFYNTDHIFMTEKELKTFKKELNFYKYDSRTDIRQKIRQLAQKLPPPI